MKMKNHFHIKGWALNLVLIQGTRKWPIFWFAGSLGLELTSTTTILVPSSLAVGLSENMEPKNWFIAGADPGFLMGGG